MRATARAARDSASDRPRPAGLVGVVLDAPMIGRSSISVPRNGERLIHSTASSRLATCQIQKPATSSLASANGPSITVAAPSRSKATRVPTLLGANPSPASMTPASTSDSLNLFISMNRSSGGSSPAVAASFSLTRTMTRIVVTPSRRPRTGPGCPICQPLAYPGVEWEGADSTRSANFFRRS